MKKILLLLIILLSVSFAKGKRNKDDDLFKNSFLISLSNKSVCFLINQRNVKICFLVNKLPVEMIAFKESNILLGSLSNDSESMDIYFDNKEVVNKIFNSYSKEGRFYGKIHIKKVKGII